MATALSITIKNDVKKYGVFKLVPLIVFMLFMPCEANKNKINSLTLLIVLDAGYMCERQVL